MKLMVTMKEVPLDRLMHNDRPAYVHAGYGGRPVEEWPFFPFIQAWLQGSEQQARRDWIQWLEEQYRLYGAVPKHLGGMRSGSVHRGAMERAGLSIGEPPESAVRASVEALVDRRLEMVRSIRDRGFRPEEGEPVIAVPGRGAAGRQRLVLQGGHHRVATLRALGRETFPVLRRAPRIYAFAMVMKKRLKSWRQRSRGAA